MPNSFLTPSDERRAAAYLLHWLRGDTDLANTLAEDGPVHLASLMKAVTSVFPESYMDPDPVIARAEQYVQLLRDSESGQLDDDQADGDG